MGDSEANVVMSQTVLYYLPGTGAEDWSQAFGHSCRSGELL